MRRHLASSIGVASTTVLALSLALPAAAARPATVAVPTPADRSAAGSTQSLRLVPLNRPRTPDTVPEWGLSPQAVHPFSMIGIVWKDPSAELHGRAQVRTRESGTSRWSGWQELEVHGQGHGPDPQSAEGRSSRLRGATAPLWVGDSDGVEVRVRANKAAKGQTRTPALPEGLQAELIDPGADTPRQAGDAAEAGDSEGSGLAGSRANPATSAVPEAADAAPGQRAGPYTTSRPKIVTRRGWGADENLRESGFGYTGKVKVAFVHHTATGNGYKCSQAPSVIRGIYRYHVVSSGWRDIGYNFLVDKCGNIYEGRAGGVDKAVLGAHTMGFNSDSMGIAAIGAFESSTPPAAMVNAIAKLAAWKLGLYGMDPRGTTYLRSAGGNRFPAGQNARLKVVSGHRDGYSTECPGKLLYGKLGTIRSSAARYQGR
ncbi:peptidoglycan recognition protein [Streptomyces sp. RY43-2]|uniref:Peptidoglycan recognition protein n=1 Tax=Streptomyces macrolidinus TaxID=2952607 RepID=A0ABT0ZKM9_9ACTN|nr:peptidoglycan recognition protein [Streptomyces macrolidinus]MCN9244111.1 peptidoglycan recognition protein [Streptomyces macrolidinus]